HLDVLLSADAGVVASPVLLPSSHHPPGQRRPLHSFPTRRSSDLGRWARASAGQSRRRSAARRCPGWSWRSTGGTWTGQKAICWRSEEHTSELQSRFDLVCRLLLENTNIGTPNSGVTTSHFNENNQ